MTAKDGLDIRYLMTILDILTTMNMVPQRQRHIDQATTDLPTNTSKDSSRGPRQDEEENEEEQPADRSEIFQRLINLLS